MTIKLDKIRQLMGRLVVVTKVSRRREGPYQSGGFTSTMDPYDIRQRAGWVVGVRWYCDGMSVQHGDGYRHEPEGPAIPHLLVCFWPTQNPVKVPMDGWRLRQLDHHEYERDPLPWDGVWTDEDRAREAERAKSYPRDSKGRFM